MNGVFWASCGTGFAFLMTSLGAATVLLVAMYTTKTSGGRFLIRRLCHGGEDLEKEPSCSVLEGSLQRIFMGFAAGVMIAASIWSLLLPAMEEAKKQGDLGVVPAAGGFIIGVTFLIILDKKVRILYKKKETLAACGSRKTTLLISAVTIHNIPEGMAVGLAFALAAQYQDEAMLYASAMALAIGIGVQNFPEGAAVSLPLLQEGFSAGRAFLVGALSGIVEPIFGIGAVFLAGSIRPYMPWLLSFAAGAMMYVVAKELIPASASEEDDKGSIAVMGGFLLMMILDVALG